LHPTLTPPVLEPPVAVRFLGEPNRDRRPIAPFTNLQRQSSTAHSVGPLFLAQVGMF